MGKFAYYKAPYGFLRLDSTYFVFAGLLENEANKSKAEVPPLRSRMCLNYRNIKESPFKTYFIAQYKLNFNFRINKSLCAFIMFNNNKERNNSTPDRLRESKQSQRTENIPRKTQKYSTLSQEIKLQWKVELHRRSIIIISCSALIYLLV